jgi:hypothetical protein
LLILYPDETARLFQTIADTKNDQPLQLPLIAISRDRDIEILNTNRKPLTYTGKTFRMNGKQIDHLNGIPISLSYQIDIYTRFREEADEYIRNFVFNIINYPTLEIELPYHDCKLGQKSFMSLQSTISDNSDIPERLVSGEFTRMTINVVLSDAYLFSYEFEDKLDIEVDQILVHDNLTKQNNHENDLVIDLLQTK